MSINKDILFRRRGAVVVPLAEALSGKSARLADGATKEALLATASVNIGALGYRFSEDFFKSALDSKLGISGLAQYLTEVIAVVRSATGANRKYKPLYPNFPAQVIEASDLELYVNAMVHYFGDWLGVRIIPNYVADEREALDAPKLSELTELRVVGVTKRGLSYKVAQTEFDGIFTSLLSMKSSWGESERSDVLWFIGDRGEGVSALIPDVIPNKENLGALAVVAKDLALPELFGALIERAATATDILRIAVGLSGGDTALNGIGVASVRFASQPKAVRRALISRLEAIADGRSDRLVEDMLRNSALWKLLSHSLHIGEYAKRFPLAAEAAAVIRANGKTSSGARFVTFGTEVEALISTAEKVKKNDSVITELVSLLAQRPGVFARRLDKVLRIATDKSIVIDAFAPVAASVATPVLWQLRNFYVNRELVAGKNPKLSRSFIPKGRASKMLYAEKALPVLDSVVSDSVVDIIDGAIASVYRDRDALGNVFISEELKGYTVPFGARSASAALNPVGRGTRASIAGDTDTIRFFIFWKDGDSRTDLDLSALFLDENFAVAGQVAYYNLRNEGAAHSGDITSAPNGASEYIDIDRKKMLKLGRRYIAMVVNSYTHQSFDTLPEVFAGALALSGDAQKGKIYEPRKIQNAFDVTTPGTMTVPLIIDLQDSSFIWADLAVSGNVMYPNNVASNESALSRTVRGLVESQLVSLYDVFSANAVRGKLVKSREKADVVVEVNRGRVVVNGEVVGTDRILSEWI